MRIELPQRRLGQQRASGDSVKRSTYGVKLERSSPLVLPRHPDAPRRHPWKQWAKQQQAEGPIAIDLFSGAGGLSLGLERAGYRVVLSADHDSAAVQTHLANFPGAALNLDLSSPDEIDGLIELLSDLEVDLVAGGPPCQPFSRAGRSKIRDLVERGHRDPLDPRRELWQAMLRVIEETKPKAVLMENVPDMALGDDMRTVRHMARELERWGYDTDMRIVDAWRYGVPQHRQRLIFVAVREGFFEWPKDTGEAIPLKDVLSDLPKLRDATGARELRYRGAKTDFQREAREGVAPKDASLLYDHVTRPVREDDRKAFALLKPGARYSELPEELKRYRDDIFDDKYNRLPWDGLSRSITAHLAKDGYWYIHPREHRTITVREAARIQTFPDYFRFSGSRSDAFRLIGNAVPPKLGEVMGRELLAAVERGASAEPQGSKERSLRREALLHWQSHEQGLASRCLDNPWWATVAAVAGARNAEKAESVLTTAATPSDYLTRRNENGDDFGLSATALAQLDSVAKRVAEGTWEQALAELPAPTATWVEAIGFGRRHLIASAPVLRVATRLSGSNRPSGVPARILLGQLVGYDEDAPQIQAAVIDLAASVCRPRRPTCGKCPLQTLCRSANKADLR